MAEMSIAELEKRLKFSGENKDPEGEVASLKKLGFIFQENRRLTQAASCLSKAMNLIEKTGNDRDRALARAHLGCVYWEMAQLNKAAPHFQEALKIQGRIQDVAVRKAVLALLGMSYWRKRQWQAGLSCFQEAVDSRKTENSNTGKPATEEDVAPLQKALERGAAVLRNRVRLGRERNDDVKILQPMFSMIPLLLFTGGAGGIEPLLKEAGFLAERLRRKDILDAIPRLRLLVEDFIDSSRS